MSRLRCSLLLVLFASACTTSPARGQDDLRVFERYRALLERARGLKFKRPVPTTTITPAAFRKLSWGGHDPQPDQQEEPGTEAWKALGLIPRSLNRGQAEAANDDALVGGFYVQDPGTAFKQGSLVLIQRRGDRLAVVSAHELLHALHDQHFDLLKATAAIPKTPFGVPRFDAELAHNGLEEGVATLLGDEVGETFGDHSAVPPGPFETRDWIAAKSSFPYAVGRAFAATLRQRGGLAGLNRAYANPPTSSEQLLHPERYLRKGRDLPSAVALPDLTHALPGRWQVVDENDLGELGWAWLAGRAAGAGWDGDRYQVLQDDTGRTIVVAATTWDTVADATEFRLAAGASKTLLRGLKPGLHLALEQRGKQVVFVTGVEAAEIGPLLAAGRAARVTKQPGDDDTWPRRPKARSPIAWMIGHARSGRTIVRRGKTLAQSGRVHTLALPDRRAATSALRALSAQARRDPKLRRTGQASFSLGADRTLRYRDGVVTLRVGRVETPKPTPRTAHQGIADRLGGR